ncbi:3-deoxy-D-manno-octulosonic-acid transferase [Palleronia marisminoris]|uniref:3-deoxy-D-manno-octulosonic acid transferase n=1 Tax=Palleronia marisminoris TaxID=315423 RepID=A0A1Y5SK25_9RHOB|nr:glycosyltransferase N-terminal domain-containing protein [Palleronia marisminoris]SFG83236.1 3-deoxy-D-manno-octulosonic-acid transferase [Palleronia marisminoris]SLN40903.1 3-deoxy-D-manno-octulosonic acid transferase [Palleronia marisminoris]
MAGFSLTLLRHRLAAARDQARRPRPAMAPQGRPEGRLIWAHFGAGVRAAGVRIVLERLRREHPDLRFVTTGQGTHPDLTAPPPTDAQAAARAFLDHWSPDLAIFSGTDTFPTLWAEALSRGIPLFAADVEPARQALPLVQEMARFDAVLARAPDPRLGPALEVVGPLSTTPMSPSANAAALEAMADALATRPIWYALDAGREETELILGAHRRASRMAHRLVLVLSTSDPEVEAKLDAGGWQWCWCEDSGQVQSDTQVIVSRPGRRTGLWLRLSPITYMGGTILGKGSPVSPQVPAALGSVVIHGPRLGAVANDLEPLRERGASRMVRDGDGLGEAVEQLLNPEEAAKRAARGWEATSAGAEAAAYLFELVDDTLAGIPV